MAAMSIAGLVPAGAQTLARSVAKLTVARTSSGLFSFFSTRAAQAAQVIPRTDSSMPVAAADPPATAADDIAARLPSCWTRSAGLCHCLLRTLPGAGESAEAVAVHPLPCPAWTARHRRRGHELRALRNRGAHRNLQDPRRQRSRRERRVRRGADHRRAVTRPRGVAGGGRGSWI